MTGTYGFAGKNIAVSSLCEDVHRLCADYKTGGAPDFHVRIEQKDIDYEREKADEKGYKNGIFVVNS